MNTLYILLAIYYFIGIAYSYEVYKQYDKLDNIGYFTQGIYITFIYSPLWLIPFLRPKVRKIREYISVKRNQFTNTIPKYKERKFQRLTKNN